jgi:hypothetical protein
VKNKGEKTMEKYKLTNHQNELHVLGGANIITYQIEALINIPSIGVKAGDKGGFVVDEHRLSQTGNCWLYPDSVATDRTEISGNAVVTGESVLSSGAKVRGDCVIENSEIGGNTLIDGHSVIRKSMLYDGCKILNDVEIITSELRAVHMESGSITHSTVRANSGSPLKTKGEVVIKDSKLDIYGQDNFIKKGCWFESVDATDIQCLQFHERVRFLYSKFRGESHMEFGGIDEKNEHTSIIEGIKGRCILEQVTLKVIRSHIAGIISVKGNVAIKDSHVFDCASIINNTPNFLSLTDVRMKELSSIVKDSRKTDSIVLKTLLTMEDTISC